MYPWLVLNSLCSQKYPQTSECPAPLPSAAVACIISMPRSCHAGNGTQDLVHTQQALFQLSYIPSLHTVGFHDSHCFHYNHKDVLCPLWFCHPFLGFSGFQATKVHKAACKIKWPSVVSPWHPQKPSWKYRGCHSQNNNKPGACLGWALQNTQELPTIGTSHHSLVVQELETLDKIIGKFHSLRVGEPRRRY